MQPTRNFFIILFLGLFINRVNCSAEITKEPNAYLKQIETVYEKIIKNPNLTEDEKDFLSNSQRVWKIYYEKEMNSYKFNFQSELNDEFFLENNISDLENSKLKKRLDVLNNIYSKLTDQGTEKKRFGINAVTAPGGYNTNNYPHSNLDIINTKHITDNGYLNARKAAFMPPTIVEEITETKIYENYDNLQYAEILGDWGKYSGSGANYTYDTYGVIGTIFHRFNPNWLAGLNYGYANSVVDYKNLYGSDEEINTFGINTYLVYQKNNWLVTGQAGYSLSKHNLNRYIIDENSKDIVGIRDLERKLDKEFDSNTYTTGLEIGYNYKINDNSYLYPYVGLDYLWNSRDSYSENTDDWTGKTNRNDGIVLDGYGVNVNKSDYNTAISKLGIMGQTFYEKWTITGDLAWIRHFSDYDNITGTYQDLSNAEFVANKLNPGKNIAYISLGVSYSMDEQLMTGVDFTGTYRSKQLDNQIGLNLVYKF